MTDIKNQEIIDLQKQINKNLFDLAELYFTTKEWFILSEELLPELGFFLSPLLEQRDALDHLMRGFNQSDDEICSQESKLASLKNRLAQISKAYAHELRAFFDVADYICINIRLNISNALKHISRKKIISIWDCYLQSQKDIIEFCENFAKARCDRGEKDYREYVDQLKEVVRIYKYFKINIEPCIKTKNYN